jgi:RNA polymerase sigma-70 factor (ECF subfamily)
VDENTLTNLAAACRRGDKGSFRELVESATRTLVALAYRYTQDWEAARDLTQDTWIKVYRSIDTYDPGRSFRGWLYTVHRNTCLSHLRSAAVRRETAMPPEELAARDAATVGTQPQTDVERGEFFVKLTKALEELSENQRRVFTKVHMEQFTQREAAAALGMSFNTLRTTLHFARKRLAGILRNMEEAS